MQFLFSVLCQQISLLQVMHWAFAARLATLLVCLHCGIYAVTICALGIICCQYSVKYEAALLGTASSGGWDWVSCSLVALHFWDWSAIAFSRGKTHCIHTIYCPDCAVVVLDSNFWKLPCSLKHYGHTCWFPENIMNVSLSATVWPFIANISFTSEKCSRLKAGGERLTDCMLSFKQKGAQTWDDLRWVLA